MNSDRTWIIGFWLFMAVGGVLWYPSIPIVAALGCAIIVMQFREDGQNRIPQDPRFKSVYQDLRTSGFTAQEAKDLVDEWKTIGGPR